MPVYLIHFSRPYKSGRASVRHYMGATSNLRQRMKDHRAGRGSALLSAVARRGIPFSVVKTWAGRWAVEEKLKRSKNLAALCPKCKRRS